jgi:ABC-2 type transport system ATP-binding protein
MLKLLDVDKSYSDNRVLCKLNLELPTAHCIGIIGKNGTGKSTILKIICGFITKFEGLCYKNFKTFSALIENPHFIDGLTGRDNIKYILNKKDADNAILLVSDFGIGDYLDRSVRRYSMGMKQKLALAITFARDSELYLLDEPFNSIDYETVTKIINIINSKRVAGKSIITVTHNMSRIQDYCNKIYQLKNGVLCANEHTVTNSLKQKSFLIKFANLNDISFAKSVIGEFSCKESYQENSIIVKAIEDDISSIIKRLADYSLIGITEIKDDNNI